MNTDQGFYAKHEKIYPREVHGLFARLRIAGVLLLLVPYYLLPWIQLNGQQALLFDLPARKFHIFGLTLWPQDFVYLALLLIILGIALFFFTALAGRLWCGYSCPQTVYTEAFLWIERRLEGSRNKQIKMDKGAMTGRKFVIKTTKHTIWLLFSLLTGLTFVGYFTPMNELVSRFFSFELGPWENFWVWFYGLATYGNAGFLREQVCIYMCPYARFQSAMFDKDTLVISYDPARGEPRSKRKKGQDASQLGDCVDCSLCVQVCPTGIDIRDGLQYQCIGCAACVDACNGVMEKLGMDKGLVSYTTENAMEGQKTRVLRPRIIAYAIVLMAVTVALVISVLNKPELELDIIRDRNVLYRTTSEGLIENTYNIRVLNMSKKDQVYTLSLETDIAGARIEKHPAIRVRSGENITMNISVIADPGQAKSPITSISFSLRSSDGQIEVKENSRFIRPARH